MSLKLCVIGLLLYLIIKEVQYARNIEEIYRVEYKKFIDDDTYYKMKLEEEQDKYIKGD